MPALRVRVVLPFSIPDRMLAAMTPLIFVTGGVVSSLGKALPLRHWPPFSKPVA